MAIIISADEIKKTLPGYSPDKAEEVHHVSATMADKQFSKELKNNSEKFVILMNGGTASGKTEFLVTQLDQLPSIIFDATQSTIQGAQNKIREINKRKKVPVIYSVVPDDLTRAYDAFLNRDRKFSDAHFYRTHSESRKTLLWIAKNNPEIEIHIVESSYSDQGNLLFAELIPSSREKLIAYLEDIQITEADIIKSVTKA